MKSIDVNTAVLRILGALAAIAVAGGGPAIAQSTNATPVTPPSQSGVSPPRPPGLARFKIRQDTPQEREAFLKRREQFRVGPAPTAVTPLPEQKITPRAPQSP